MGSGWKPKAGDNLIRLLPPRSIFLTNPGAMEDLAISYRMHYFRLDGRPTEVSRCLEPMKQRCPACEAWRIHRKASDPKMAEAVRDIGPSDIYLFNMIDLQNYQAGIQRWGANFTCWDKIMDIASNPSWGNVVDPDQGVNFRVSMTPAQQSRTGFNSYSVMPEPQRTSMTSWLDTSIPGWREQLDQLEESIIEAKDVEEIRAMIAEMGFAVAEAPRSFAVPGIGAPPGAPPPPPMMAPPSTAAPPPIMAPPTTAAPPVAAPLPGIAAPPPGVVAPPPGVVAPPPGAPIPPPMVGAPVTAPPPIPVAPMPAAQTQALPVGGVHYDPGPAYTPKLDDAHRPVGVPRCFSDYNPQVHACATCPVMTPCQMKMLGLVS